jgi:hypothetical protein
LFATAILPKTEKKAKKKVGEWSTGPTKVGGLWEKIGGPTKIEGVVGVYWS